MRKLIVAGLMLVATAACTPLVEQEAGAPAGCQSTEWNDDFQYDTEYVRDWNAYLAQGWTGVAGDHAERLYSPQCFLTAEDGSRVFYTFYA